jgi:hypothetical protein
MSHLFYFFYKNNETLDVVNFLGRNMLIFCFVGVSTEKPERPILFTISVAVSA